MSFRCAPKSRAICLMPCASSWSVPSSAFSLATGVFQRFHAHLLDLQGRDEGADAGGDGADEGGLGGDVGGALVLAGDI